MCKNPMIKNKKKKSNQKILEEIFNTILIFLYKNIKVESVKSKNKKNYNLIKYKKNLRSKEERTNIIQKLIIQL